MTFPLLRNKTPPDLNNSKACPRRRVDRLKTDFRDFHSAMVEISELGNGDDAVPVPSSRQDRIQEPRQGAAWRPRRQSVEFGYSCSAEIADKDWSVRSNRQRNPEAPVPKKSLSWPQANRGGSGGKLSQDKDPVPPNDKAAAAERVPSAPASSEALAQARHPPASRRIDTTADCRSKYGEDPLGDLRRCRKRETGIEHSKPRGMQGQGMRKNSITLALLNYPLAAECADLTIQRCEIRIGRSRAALAQTRPLEARVAVARIGDERLPLGFQQRRQSDLWNTEQRP